MPAPYGACGKPRRMLRGGLVADRLLGWAVCSLWTLSMVVAAMWRLVGCLDGPYVCVRDTVHDRGGLVAVSRLLGGGKCIPGEAPARQGSFCGVRGCPATVPGSFPLAAPGRVVLCRIGGPAP